MNPPTARRTKRKAASAAPAVPKRPFVAHHLAPPHEVLGEDESRTILAQIGSPIEQLPRIMLSDPGLQTDPKYAALRDGGENLVGRLVRVRRPSPTAGEAVAYRVIVATGGGE
ncbi:MAG TPA: DNA-directed RNA polymerase subunit RpoH/Rpb5 C-terminal domain-containing protein [Thermoplasmata archaeon]|nr:DNA-directed RNA polymerase subunit RpoH/Rpb5 C-terminal domain-containing protein [Thermoplasmata archaeon]